VYNWGLEQRKVAYEESGKTLGFFEQNTALNAIKREQFPWMLEVSSAVPLWALKNLETAYRNFFRRVKEGGGPPGFPRFKSRARGLGSFHASTLRVESSRVKLPVIGWVRLKEAGYLPEADMSFHRITVSERAGRWYISVVGDQEVEESRAQGGTVAVHLGVRVLATMLADDDELVQYANPRHLEAALRRLKRAQQSLARCQKGSQRRERAKARVATLYARIADLRRDNHHQVSTAITRRHAPDDERPGAVVVEDWDVREMLRQKHPNGRAAQRNLSRAISDSAMGDLGRMVRYKAEWSGSEIVEGERFYASSRTCSRCGWVWEAMTLGDLEFRCETCGLVVDREVNAVTNVMALMNVAGRSPETLNGRRGEVSPSSEGTPR
jgi:putative transposase